MDRFGKEPDIGSPSGNWQYKVIGEAYSVPGPQIKPLQLPTHVHGSRQPLPADRMYTVVPNKGLLDDVLGDQVAAAVRKVLTNTEQEVGDILKWRPFE